MLWKVNMKVLNVIQTGRGGEEIGITTSSVVTYRIGQSEDSRQNEMPWGGSCSIQRSHSSEGGLQCSLPRGYGKVAVGRKVKRRKRSSSLHHQLQVRKMLVEYPQARE